MPRDAPNIESLTIGVRRLITAGHAMPPRRHLREVLREIERPSSAVTTEGTDALEGQRGERP